MLLIIKNVFFFLKHVYVFIGFFKPFQTRTYPISVYINWINISPWLPCDF